MLSLTGDNLSIIDFLYYSTIFFLSMASFLNRGSGWKKIVYYIWMTIFIAVWGVAMSSSRPTGTKAFITILLVSSVVLQISLSWRRRQVNFSTK